MPSGPAPLSEFCGPGGGVAGGQEALRLVRLCRAAPALRCPGGRGRAGRAARRQGAAPRPEEARRSPRTAWTTPTPERSAPTRPAGLGPGLTGAGGVGLGSAPGGGRARPGGAGPRVVARGLRAGPRGAGGGARRPGAARRGVPRHRARGRRPWTPRRATAPRAVDVVVLLGAGPLPGGRLGIVRGLDTGPLQVGRGPSPMGSMPGHWVTACASASGHWGSAWGTRSGQCALACGSVRDVGSSQPWSGPVGQPDADGCCGGTGGWTAGGRGGWADEGREGRRGSAGKLGHAETLGTGGGPGLVRRKAGGDRWAVKASKFEAGPGALPHRRDAVQHPARAGRTGGGAPGRGAIRRRPDGRSRRKSDRPPEAARRRATRTARAAGPGRAGPGRSAGRPACAAGPAGSRTRPGRSDGDEEDGVSCLLPNDFGIRRGSSRRFRVNAWSPGRRRRAHATDGWADWRHQRRRPTPEPPSPSGQQHARSSRRSAGHRYPGRRVEPASP